MNTVASIALMIDHSILHPTFTDEDLQEQCAIAAKYHVASVCVKPYAVKDALDFLQHTGVEVGCVIGFPHGNSHIDVKEFEAITACYEGATEIDMVVNIGKVLSGDWEYVEYEIKTVTDACHKCGSIIKVIFETDFITSDEDIIQLCQICTRVGADFVKTSTGYGFVKKENGDYNYAGATAYHVELMRLHSGPQVKVKAAGGVRTLDDLLLMQSKGAVRVGATATGAIMAEAAERFK